MQATLARGRAFCRNRYSRGNDADRPDSSSLFAARVSHYRFFRKRIGSPFRRWFLDDRPVEFEIVHMQPDPRRNITRGVGNWNLNLAPKVGQSRAGPSDVHLSRGAGKSISPMNPSRIHSARKTSSLLGTRQRPLLSLLLSCDSAGLPGGQYSDTFQSGHELTLLEQKQTRRLARRL